MSHRMYLAVMLYGSDVEKAEIIMPNTCSLNRERFRSTTTGRASTKIDIGILIVSQS